MNDLFGDSIERIGKRKSGLGKRSAGGTKKTRMPSKAPKRLKSASKPNSRIGKGQATKPRTSPQFETPIWSQSELVARLQKWGIKVPRMPDGTIDNAVLSIRAGFSTERNWR